MRPDPRQERDQRGGGGIPDGLLVGILGFLLGITILVWTATGLAAWFAHGSWPSTVRLSRTPLAMRHLIGAPHDVTGAWPDTPAAQLAGWGLFWGLFIGQLMVLAVLTVFVLGTVTRWRAGRRRRAATAAPAVAAESGRAAAVPDPRTEPETVQETVLDTGHGPGRGTSHGTVRGTGHGPVRGTARPMEPAHPLEPSLPTAQIVEHPGSEQGPEAVRPAPGGNLPGAWARIHIAPRDGRQAIALQAIQDALGPALVVTSNATLWSETKDARAKLGPVLLYDPNHLCDTPARFHWSPTAHCEDKPTAIRRAQALLTPVKPTARIDQTVADTAETLLRSYLHAAALENRTVRHVHRWAQGTGVQDAVRTLRTHPKAAPGAAGELEAALTSHPERRDIAQELTARALAALFTVNIREACTPNRSDALALDSFVAEGGTLYVVGESIEDPRTNPGAMPLLTALVSSVVEHGRRMAERSSSGRLDPPLTLVLDDVAAVAPLPQLPDLLAAGPDQGLPTLALLRSHEQARSRWPHRELPV
ncbi:type IV secretory system conjugative DNA transfer family protein [Streptomyces shenzhenensis]|uniref:type IV secretory system conjugative DNA transfer family protein n=1 Tax=Streptomyces shenzhenensis TaxID=943815 RepID=UPI001F17B8E5|nr:type IV secretory system conjugative DNA transfer family protein [Streptomyces shenzhenensis]